MWPVVLGLLLRASTPCLERSIDFEKGFITCFSKITVSNLSTSIGTFQLANQRSRVYILERSKKEHKA